MIEELPIDIDRIGDREQWEKSESHSKSSIDKGVDRSDAGIERGGEVLIFLDDLLGIKGIGDLSMSRDERE